MAIHTLKITCSPLCSLHISRFWLWAASCMHRSSEEEERRRCAVSRAIGTIIGHSLVTAKEKLPAVYPRSAYVGKILVPVRHEEKGSCSLFLSPCQGPACSILAVGLLKFHPGSLVPKKGYRDRTPTLPRWKHQCLRKLSVFLFLSLCQSVFQTRVAPFFKI